MILFPSWVRHGVPELAQQLPLRFGDRDQGSTRVAIAANLKLSLEARRSPATLGVPLQLLKRCDGV